MGNIDVQKIREDFPILQTKVNGKPLVYFDNAATTQKPNSVLQAMDDFYKKYNSNIHRSIHTLGEKATSLYEEAHNSVSKFIGAKFEEVIFTKSTTESLNLLAYSLGNNLVAGDELIVSDMEHHSNFVPWQQLALRKKSVLKSMGINEQGELDLDQLGSIITEKTKIVSLTHVSNVLGTINDVKTITEKIKKINSNTKVIIDAAQSVPHMKVDVKQLGCDFLAFSGHKMCGPTGIGVLYGKQGLLEGMDPFLYGGEMIKTASFAESTWNDLPWKFEAGTMNLAEAVGLKATIDYLQAVGLGNIQKHDQEMIQYAMKRMKEIKELEVYGPAAEKRSSIVAFNVGKMHAHDTAAFLDKEGIAVRAGHHCAMPLAEKLGITASARASFYLYNSKEEIDTFIEVLGKMPKEL